MKIAITSRFFSIFMILGAILIIFSSKGSAQKLVILDTDPSADPDDVGCMAMLHNMANQGECHILAMINSTHFKQSPLSISAINEFYNRSAIPIGDYKGYKEKIESPPTNYDYHLSRVYPRKIKSWKEALDGVKLYREVLASAADTSITIAIIGTMQNFADLLRSKGDEFSPLSGIELVRKKVHQVVTMGGNFINGHGYDRTNWGGSDTLCNYTNWSCLNRERNDMCRYVIDHCPSPFIASGWEVGCGDYYNAEYGNVMSGKYLLTLDSTHILRRAYEYHFLTRGETENMSRHSNDQCALHYAVRGESDNYQAYPNGVISLSEDGTCGWKQTDKGIQGFIQKAKHKDSIAAEIEHLMMLDITKQDMSQPAKPTGLIYNAISGKLTWDKSTDDTQGSWVVGYNVYLNDDYIATAYGEQILLKDKIPQGSSISIKALNANGLESESNTISIK